MGPAQGDLCKSAEALPSNLEVFRVCSAKINPQAAAGRQRLLAFKNPGEGHFDFEDVLQADGIAAYVAWLGKGERGELGDAGDSPWSVYWLADSNDGSIVGISSLRHVLSESMQERGGQVG